MYYLSQRRNPLTMFQPTEMPGVHHNDSGQKVNTITASKVDRGIWKPNIALKWKSLVCESKRWKLEECFSLRTNGEGSGSTLCECTLWHCWEEVRTCEGNCESRSCVLSVRVSNGWQWVTAVPTFSLTSLLWIMCHWQLFLRSLFLPASGGYYGNGLRRSKLGCSTKILIYLNIVGFSYRHNDISQIPTVGIFILCFV